MKNHHWSQTGAFDLAQLGVKSSRMNGRQETSIQRTSRAAEPGPRAEPLPFTPTYGRKGGLISTDAQPGLC